MIKSIWCFVYSLSLKLFNLCMNDSDIRTFSNNLFMAFVESEIIMYFNRPHKAFHLLAPSDTVAKRQLNENKKHSVVAMVILNVF